MTSIFNDLNDLNHRPLTLDKNNHHVYQSALDVLTLIIPQIKNKTYKSTVKFISKSGYERNLQTTFESDIDMRSLKKTLFQRNRPTLIFEEYRYPTRSACQTQSYLWYDDNNHVVCLIYDEHELNDRDHKYYLFAAKTMEQLINKLKTQYQLKRNSDYNYYHFKDIADELVNQQLDVMYDDLAKLTNICELCSNDNVYINKSKQLECQHQNIKCLCDDWSSCSSCVFGSSKGRRFLDLDESFQLHVSDIEQCQTNHLDCNLDEISIESALTERNHPQLLHEYYRSRYLDDERAFHAQSQSYIWYTDDKIPVCLIYDDMSCEYHNYTNYKLYSANTINEIINKIEQTMKDFGNHTKDCCIAELKQLITNII